MNIDYRDTIKTRISDINYGNHVGHVELINLLHEIRVRFLHQYSLKETDVNGYALVMHHLNITYKNQVLWNNELDIHMKIRIDGVKIIFYYRAFNITLKNDAAVAEASMVLLDKNKGKPVKSDIFVSILNKKLIS